MLFKCLAFFALGLFALNGRDHKVDDRGGNDCAHTHRPIEPNNVEISIPRHLSFKRDI